MPVSHTSSLAQTTKIVHLQRIWFSFLAFRNNRWIARLFTVASHKLPVSKLLYYLWNRKITKKYLSWLLPAGEPLPEKLFIQICVWKQRSLLLQGFFVGFWWFFFWYYFYNCLFHNIPWPCCAALPSRYFLHPDIFSWIEISVNVWRSQEVGGKHAFLLERSAMNKKCLKPFCFTMTMMNEMLLMWY